MSNKLLSALGVVSQHCLRQRGGGRERKIGSALLVRLALVRSRLIIALTDLLLVAEAAHLVVAPGINALHASTQLV